METIVKKEVQEGVITRDSSGFLLSNHTKIPVMYTLPKIHKDVHAPPERAVVSGRDSVFVPVAQFLEKILYPLISKTFSYIRDTKDFLHKIRFLLLGQENYILVTRGVNGLYTSISHTEGISVALQLRVSELYTEAQIIIIQRAI